MKAYYKNLSIEDIKGEEWRDIPGYDGIYQASSYGRIKSVERLDTIGRLLKEKIMKQYFDKVSRDLYVSLRIPGQKNKRRSVGSIVGMCFVGLRENKKVFAHKNKNSLDNRACNIIKITYSESRILDYKCGKQPRVIPSIYIYSSSLGEYTYSQLVDKYGKKGATAVLLAVGRGYRALGIKWTKTPIQNNNKP